MNIQQGNSIPAPIANQWRKKKHFFKGLATGLLLDKLMANHPSSGPGRGDGMQSCCCQPIAPGGACSLALNFTQRCGEFL